MQIYEHRINAYCHILEHCYVIENRPKYMQDIRAKLYKISKTEVSDFKNENRHKNAQKYAKITIEVELEN